MREKLRKFYTENKTMVIAALAGFVLCLAMFNINDAKAVIRSISDGSAKITFKTAMELPKTNFKKLDEVLESPLAKDYIDYVDDNGEYTEYVFFVSTDEVHFHCEVTKYKKNKNLGYEFDTHGRYKDEWDTYISLEFSHKNYKIEIFEGADKGCSMAEDFAENLPESIEQFMEGQLNS